MSLIDPELVGEVTASPSYPSRGQGLLGSVAFIGHRPGENGGELAGKNVGGHVMDLHLPRL